MNLFILVLTVSSCFYLSASEFVCQDGVPYIENECNRCHCGGGDLACTMMACPHMDQYRRCQIGAVTRKGCNTCTCVQDKGTICTAYSC